MGKMKKGIYPPDNGVSEMLLQRMFRRLEGMEISKNTAIKLAGGRASLEFLLENEQIRFGKQNKVQNGKWNVNLGDLMRALIYYS